VTPDELSAIQDRADHGFPLRSDVHRLLSEVQRLRGEVETVARGAQRAVDIGLELSKAVAEHLSERKRLQWIVEKLGWNNFGECNLCTYPRTHGHATDCPFTRLLESCHEEKADDGR
jgi:hypothetical protein